MLKQTKIQSQLQVVEQNKALDGYSITFQLAYDGDKNFPDKIIIKDGSKRNPDNDDFITITYNKYYPDDFSKDNIPKLEINYMNEKTGNLSNTIDDTNDLFSRLFVYLNITLANKNGVIKINNNIVNFSDPKSFEVFEMLKGLIGQMDIFFDALEEKEYNSYKFQKDNFNKKIQDILKLLSPANEKDGNNDGANLNKQFENILQEYNRIEATALNLTIPNNKIVEKNSNYFHS
jgi:hypothetical protein